MQPPRFRLRTILVLVAFFALVMAVVVQSVRLQQVVIRERQLRAEAEYQRAVAEAAAAQARAAVDQLHLQRDEPRLPARAASP